MTHLSNAAGPSARPLEHERRPLHIVWVADGSPDAAAGAQTIRALPLPPGSEISVLTPPLAGAPPPEAPLLAAGAAGPAAAVTRYVLPELSAQHLQEFTAARQPHLVVLGAEEPEPTVAGKLREALNPLVEQLALPVLVARQPFQGLRRILLAYDGSPDSQAAVEFLARLPLPPESVVTVLRVLTEVPSIAVVPAAGPEAPRMLRHAAALEVRDEPHAAQRSRAKTQVAHVVETLRQAGVAAHGRVLWGEAAPSILHIAAATGADLLVAGSRGLSGVWSWLLGSVSRRLVRDGRWPVLVVRGAAPGEAAPAAPA